MLQFSRMRVRWLLNKAYASAWGLGSDEEFPLRICLAASGWQSHQCNGRKVNTLQGSKCVGLLQHHSGTCRWNAGTKMRRMDLGYLRHKPHLSDLVRAGCLLYNLGPRPVDMSPLSLCVLRKACSNGSRLLSQIAISNVSYNPSDHSS